LQEHDYEVEYDDELNFDESMSEDYDEDFVGVVFEADNILQ